MGRYLEETLPEVERVPFRLKGSNPLSFVKLFKSGTKMRILALSQVANNCSSLSETLHDSAATAFANMKPFA